MSLVGAELVGRGLGCPVTVPLEAIVVAVAVSVATGVVFGFFPARRAARLDPIEALRAD